MRQITSSINSQILSGGARHRHSDPAVSPSATQLPNMPALLWARSTHARKLNPTLHDCCRIISGCLKPKNLDSVHLLAGIAPPHIRRTVACLMERTRQTTDAKHQLFHHRAAASRLKSRKSFMRTVTPLDSSASSSRLLLWKDSLTDVPASVNIGLKVAESLPAGSGEDWLFLASA